MNYGGKNLLRVEKSKDMAERRKPIRRFIWKWIFHILAAALGVAALFTPRKFDGIVASLVFLVTLIWIVRNVFSPPEE